jgi:hypothetical protein
MGDDNKFEITGYNSIVNILIDAGLMPGDTPLLLDNTLTKPPPK